MRYQTLSSSEIDEFIERGFVRLEQAFPHDQAIQAQMFLWERLAEFGITKEDPATWREPLVHIKEDFSTKVFEACATERLANAIEDLVGAGRWKDRHKTGEWGWWPVNFSLGADCQWDVPAEGWHWDGADFRHYLHSPDQGLLVLCIFSEIGPRAGGTLVAEGTHKLVARFLSQHPEGLELDEAIDLCNRSNPWLAELTGISPLDQSQGKSRIERFMQCPTSHGDAALRVVETAAYPGDVFLCHPFLYHAASQNHSGVPRFMCNRFAPLYEPLQFNRADNDYSPLELSIIRAIT